MLAVKGEITQPVVIVDCGTAITIDVMTVDGTHQGGLIVPGITLMRESLTDSTPLDVEGRQVSDVSLFARDTLDAVLGGTLFMAAAFIDRVMDDVCETFGQRPAGILCGGSARELQPLLKNGFGVRPALVLEGLLVYMEECE
jgi:type III pantothenate kinase